MTSPSGLLSGATRPMLFVSVAETTEEVHQPLLAKDDSNRNAGESRKSILILKRPPGLRQSMRRSDSLLEVRKPANRNSAVNESTQTTLRSKPPPSPGAIPRTPRPEGLRSVSNSLVESRSYSNRADYPETPTQREIMVMLSNIRNTDASKRSKEQGIGSANAQGTKDRYGTNLKWCLMTRSMSDPYMQTASTASQKPAAKPLKTCLRQRSKSADTTPTNGTTTPSTHSPDDQKLRRKKTVDFADANLGPAGVDVPDSAMRPHKPKSTKPPGQASLCPGTAVLSKRSLANPAITRTDVHVIAITPSSSKSAGSSRTQAQADPATPTMQIVESSNGSYEIVWDDVPPEHSVTTRRHSSSAGEALGALSTGSRGLERVNTKLTEWSGTWNTPSDQFKPTIVVFPDDDSHGPHFDCTVADGEDIEIIAPPNSERASAVHSRRASRPASAHMSRAPSQDDPRAILFTEDTDSSPSGQQSPIAPDPEAWPAHRLAAGRKLGVPSPDRKLSNIEEADVRFRDHRDSVTLAHSRLIKSGGVKPELIAHKDSVTLAKKRMYARNHTTSTSRQLHRLKTETEPGPLPNIDATAMPPLAVVKAHVADALQKGTPTPTLGCTDDGGEQHIRIEE